MNQANRSSLTEADHANMTAFIGHVLDLYRDGEISRSAATETLAEVMTLLDQGDHQKAIDFFRRGRKEILRG
jgi:lactam utilization protein B